MNKTKDAVETKRHKKNRSVIQNYKHAIYSLNSEEEAKQINISNTNYFGIDNQNIDIINQINKKRRNHGNISEDNTEYILNNKHLKDDYFTSFKDSQQKSTQATQLKLGLSTIEKNCSSSIVSTEGNFQLPQIMKKISKVSVKVNKKSEFKTPKINKNEISSFKEHFPINIEENEDNNNEMTNSHQTINTCVAKYARKIQGLDDSAEEDNPLTIYK